MQLTTPQIYALFAITVTVVVLIGISYISGLRTGRKAGEDAGYENGRRTAAKHWKTLISGIRETHSAIEQGLLNKMDEVRSARELHIAEASELRKQLTIEQTTAERLDNVIGRLQSKALNADDLLTLQLAARQLGLAAKQHARTGTNRPNQAELAQAALKEILARLTEAAPNPEPGLVIDQPKQKAARDEDGHLLPPPIDYIGDGKSTWERIDDEHRAQGLPAPQCM